MKKKVVLMRNMEYNFESVVFASKGNDLSYYGDEYVQLSEILEIDFPELDKEESIKKQVAVLDKQITKVMADSEVQITKLKARKQELLAITHKVE